MPEGRLVSEIVDLVFGRLADLGYRTLNEKQRHLLCVWAAAGEVGNGGFDQFFFNTSGDWSADTPAAFRALGATTLAGIVQDAMGVFPGGRPEAELEARRAQMDSLPPSAALRLSQLDEEFYAAEGDLDELIARFVRRNEQALRE
jgi:hypothetical protein